MTVAGDNILKVTARLLFESLDDVQNVYSNADLPDEILARA